MVALSALWLPIVLSAVVVFIASSIIHMVVWQWHAGDYPKVPNEDRVMDALRPLAIPPGDYMIPRCDHPREMKSPEFMEKLKKGPVMMMTVYPPGPFAMGKQLGQWFVFCAVVGLFAAYVASRALGPGVDYLSVFRMSSVTAFAGYSLAAVPASIWYKRAWGTTIRGVIDGLVYGLLTGGVFGWLWPTM